MYQYIGLLVTSGVILIITILALAVTFSGKSLSHLLAELRYELIYNVIGTRSLVEDLAMKDKNEKAVSEMSSGKGKVALVTGGARGIGVEIVKKLVELDTHVIIGCRNVKAGEALFESIRSQGITTGDVKVYQLDLASIESVKSFARTVKQKHPKINILINNAGKMFGPFEETVDGYESQFQTNYLGHFLLTHLLLPELKAAGEKNHKSRIVNVSSCAHVVGDINFDDINYKKQFLTSAAYAQSKLAQILFSNYLNNILIKEKAPVVVFSVHPGIVDTDLFNGTYLRKLVPRALIKLVFKTPLEGATSILYASLNTNMEKHSGHYISNSDAAKASELSYSLPLQEKLFDFSKSLLKIQTFGQE